MTEMTFGGRCEKHLSVKPCSTCAREAAGMSERQAGQDVPEINFGNIALSEQALNHAISQAACAVADGSETDRIQAIGKALWRQWQAQRQANTQLADEVASCMTRGLLAQNAEIAQLQDQNTSLDKALAVQDAEIAALKEEEVRILAASRYTADLCTQALDTVREQEAEIEALREAGKEALRALDTHAEQYPHMTKGYCVDAARALRVALKQP